MVIDYFPLKTGTRLEYKYKSTEFDGIAKIYIDILDVAKKPGKITARAQMTFILRDTHETEYKITKDKKWVITADGIIIGGRKEFPLPPREGVKWDEHPDANAIVSMSDKLAIKAGKFTKCMKVVSSLAGGDAGKSVRYYAPNVGYILEEYSGEDKNCEVELVSVGKIPEKPKKK
ncbi:MAG: hypothetical protein HY746_06685 [Elusimicrobia bacterium]|nr:hypothetical protein [Elusimicrobiota bacterium]